MRVSTDKNDPGYIADVRATVRFNGYEIYHVITADEERGFIVQLVLDEKGAPIIRGDELLTQKRFGGVHVVSCVTPQCRYPMATQDPCRITPEQMAECDAAQGKTRETCRAKFDNTINFRGENLFPGPDFLNRN